MKIKASKVEESAVKIFLWISVLVTMGWMISILFHILKNGLRVIDWEFLTTGPAGMGHEGGIFPSIAGTFYLAAVSLVFAAPVGIMAAIHLEEYAKKSRLVSLIRLVTEILAGIPPIIFGLFGFAFLVVFMKLGWSVLSGGLTLAVMILPTIIKTSGDAIKKVPRIQREGSLALGATKWQTLRRIVIPAALPGIATGILLGIGRAVGETAAVLLTAGSSLDLPASLLDPVRPLSTHLYFLASEGVSYKNAYGTATVLILLILIINFTAHLLMYRMNTGNR